MASEMSDSLLDKLRAHGARVDGGGVGRYIKIGAALLVLLVLIPQFFTYVEPGHVGILIHRAGGARPKDTCHLSVLEATLQPAA